MAYRCLLQDSMLCLVGTVITLYSSDGQKLKQWFYDSKEEAKAVYFASIN